MNYNRQQEEYNQEFLPQLQEKVDRPFNVTAAIQDWTRGQPVLSRKVLELTISSDDRILEGEEKVRVEQLVRSHLLDNWEKKTASPILKKLRQGILKADGGSGQVLGLYRRILQQGEVPFQDSDEATALLELGLVYRDRGRLKVCNLLYENVFNSTWVDRQLAETVSPPVNPTNDIGQPLPLTKIVSGIAFFVFIAIAIGSRLISTPYSNNDVEIPENPVTFGQTQEPDPSSGENAKTSIDNNQRPSLGAGEVTAVSELCGIPANSKLKDRIVLLKTQLSQGIEDPAIQSACEGLYIDDVITLARQTMQRIEESEDPEDIQQALLDVVDMLCAIPETVDPTHLSKAHSYLYNLYEKEQYKTNIRKYISADRKDTPCPVSQGISGL